MPRPCLLDGACSGRSVVIRLAISCDICGEEKKQTNHWFVAYEHSGELRIGGWKSRYCKRTGSRHLCGQTCLHKLMDEFMAKTIAEDRELAAAELMSLEPVAEPFVPPQHPSAAPVAVQAAVQAAAQAGSSSSSAYEDEFGSSARLISTPGPSSDAPPVPAHSESAPASAAETQKFTSHQWRSSAWERERKRESFSR